MFETILGNEPVKSYLRKAVVENILPHALLFSGPDGIGKRLFARDLAIHLLNADPLRLDRGNHPDFHPISPAGKSGLFAIETLREMIDKVHEAPFEASRKVFVLYDAERMQPAAANALLKTLEEPNPDTTLILITTSPKEILPTIQSRCARVLFQPLSEEEIKTALRENGHLEKWARLSNGSLGNAIELSSRPSFEEAIFRILSTRPPYHILSFELENLEKELSEDDPVRKGRDIDQIFSLILVWHRDQLARQLGLESKLLFPENPPVTFPLPPLDEIELKVEEAKLSLERNMKFTACLHHLFGELEATAMP